MDWDKKIYPKDILKLFSKRNKRPLGYEMVHIRIIKAVYGLFVNLYESILSTIKLRSDVKRANFEARMKRKINLTETEKRLNNRINLIREQKHQNDPTLRYSAFDHFFDGDDNWDHWDTRKDYSHLSQRRADKKIIEELQKEIKNRVLRNIRRPMPPTGRYVTK